MTRYKGECPKCHQDVAVRVDETLWIHRRPGPVYKRLCVPCPGARTYPIRTWEVNDAKN